MVAGAVLTDRYGYSLSTSSPTAARAYSDAVDRMLGGNDGTDALLEQALAADDGFALAHIAMARQHQYRGRLDLAKQSAVRATELSAGTSRREQQHVAALAASIGGDNPGALARIREHVQEFPRDAYLLSQCTGPFSLIGFGGGPDWRRECFELLTPLAPTYGDDWWFLSAYAFLHNELEHFAEARRLCERSLALEPRSAHTAHTTAHIAYETGDMSGGRAFVDGWLPGYPRDGQLFGHLTWHACLFDIAGGHYSHALDRYDTYLCPAESLGTAIITMADAAALLWRCDVYAGAAGAKRWEAVAGFARTAFVRPGITFADLHCALAFAATSDDGALATLVDGLRARVNEGRMPAGEVVPVLAEAIAAYGHGDYEGCARLLEPWQDQVVRVGGSNAQREVFEDTLLEAYLRSSQWDKAEAMLHARLARRHTPRDAFRAGRVAAARHLRDQAVAFLSEARDGWQDADANTGEAAALVHEFAALG